jgi:ankyrin repeat protein
MIRAKTVLESLEKILRIDERNVANVGEIEAWIRGLYKETSHQDVKDWLSKTVRAYMLNEYQGVSQIHNTSYYDQPWVKKALERGEPVLEIDIGPSLDGFEDEVLQAIRVMNDLYPSREYDKMVKSPVKIVFEKARDHVQRQNKFGGIEETGLKYKDGSRWVKLKTYETIENEGKLLANCLKDKPWDLADKVDAGILVLWSLRDSRNKPVVHVETKGSTLAQVAGFQNGEVPIEYRAHVFDLIEKQRLTRFAKDSLKNIHAVYHGGTLYDENSIPGSYKLSKQLMEIITQVFRIGVHISEVEDCLKDGADPNIPVDGKLPLVESARVGSISLVEMLVKYGANIDLKDDTGQSPLFAASIYAKQTWDCIRFLVARGADINTYDESGNTPLMLCSIHNQPDLAEFLLGHGAKTDHPNRTGRTPLGMAMEYGMREVFNILLESGANTDITVESEPLVLQVVLQGWADSLDIMLENGIDPNKVVEQGGVTLLMRAAMQRRVDVAQTLLDHGADPSITDGDGKTALDYANQKTLFAVDPQLVKILSEYQ